MPTIASSLPQESTIDTVVDQVAAQLVKYLGLNKDTKIHVVSDYTRRATPEGDIQVKDNSAYFSEAAETQLVVRYSDRFDENSTMYSHMYSNEFPDIWSLPRLGLRYRNAYAQSVIELQCTVGFRSRSELNRVRRAAHMAMTQRSPIYNHNVSYELDVNDAYVQLMFDVWEMQEKKAGRGQTFIDFLIEGTKLGKPGKRRNQADTVTDLYFKIDEIDIIGRMETEQYFAETTRNENRHELSFTYRLEFTQPIGTVLTYPLFVHQQRLPKRYIENWAPYMRKYTVQAEQFSTSLNQPPITNPRFYQADGGVHLDQFDEWFPEPPMPGTRTMVLAPFTLDATDPFMMVGIEDFRGIIKDSILDVIFRYKDRFMTYRKMPYGIEIWSVGAVESRLSATVASDGSLRSIYPMLPENRHYLRIYFLADLTLLDLDFLEILLNDLEMLQDLICLIDPTFRLLDEVYADGTIGYSGGRYLRPDKSIVTLTDSVDPTTLYGALTGYQLVSNPPVPVVGGKSVSRHDYMELVKRLIPTSREYKLTMQSFNHNAVSTGINVMRK